MEAMIHPHVPPESGNGPASEMPAAPADAGHVPAEGAAAPVEAPETPPPENDDAPRDLTTPAPAPLPPTPPDEPPAPIKPKPPERQTVPINVVRRMDARIRRLERAVTALIKRQRKPRGPVPIAPAAMVAWEPPATTAPSAVPPQEPLPHPESVVPPPPPAPLIPLVTPSLPSLELTPPLELAPPVAAVAPEIPVANLAAAPPVAALAPAEPAASPPPTLSGSAAPSLRERIVAVGKRAMASPVASQAMAAAAVPMARAAVALASAPAGNSTHPFHHPWIVMEAFHELRGVIRMYMDRSYRPGLYAWLIPVFALSLMICSWFFISGMPVVGPLLDRLFDLGLAYIAYKVMVREAERHELQRTRQVPV
jgi:hypothetical protein